MVLNMGGNFLVFGNGNSSNRQAEAAAAAGQQQQQKTTTTPAIRHPTTHRLSELETGLRQLDPVHPLEVRELEENLHRHLAGAHPEIVDRARLRRVQVSRAHCLVDPPGQQLPVQERALRSGGGFEQAGAAHGRSAREAGADVAPQKQKQNCQ